MPALENAGVQSALEVHTLRAFDIANIIHEAWAHDLSFRTPVLERAAEHAPGTRGIAALEKCPVERAADYRDRSPEKKSWSYRKTMKALTIDR
jgi:hypothetical protein